MSAPAMGVCAPFLNLVTMFYVATMSSFRTVTSKLIRLDEFSIRPIKTAFLILCHPQFISGSFIICAKRRFWNKFRM